MRSEALRSTLVTQPPIYDFDFTAVWLRGGFTEKRTSQDGEPLTFGVLLDSFAKLLNHIPVNHRSRTVIVGGVCKKGADAFDDDDIHDYTWEDFVALDCEGDSRECDGSCCIF